MKYINYFLKFLFDFFVIHLFIGVIFINYVSGHSTGDVKLFHFLVPLDGVFTDWVWNYFLYAIIPTIILAVLLCFLRNKLLKKWMYWSIVVTAFLFAFWQLDLFEYTYNNIVTSAFIEENYINPKDVEIRFNEKRNLIYIIIESMENTFSSKENGGYMEDNLIPNLTNISRKNISFSNSNELGGALEIIGSEYTVASMLSQLAGMPLKINIDHATKYDFNKFYIGTTLGDILYDNGYNNYIIMGSNSKYGARDNLYKNHHYAISDVNTAIEKGYMTSEDMVWWGYSDSNLFKYAKIELDEISKSTEPFNYTILTSNNHFPNGYVEENCQNKFKNQYMNVIYNNDTLINEFIEWIKEQKFYENTTIVLVGDHLSMDAKNFKNIPENYVRTTYNTFINTNVKTDNDKCRLFTQFDMLPTTINSIGGKIEGDRLGLGTNLFSDKKTIIEKYGYEYTKRELNKKSIFYNSLIGQK